MHSYKQTILQQHGVTDPDHNTSEHDHACIALTQRASDFIRRVFNRPEGYASDARCRLEVPLQKGIGQYSSTVGFLDAVIEWSECSEHNPEYTYRRAVGVEVKTSIGSIGALLRQMNLYREYGDRALGIWKWIVWSLNSADAQYSSLIEQQGYIFAMGLGPRRT